MKLLLDSGAFSCFTQGKEINLDEYCEFILKNDNSIHKSINLDVIKPGNPEVAASEGMVNFHKMLDKGIESIPVFHARESTKWLDQMIDLTDYVGLSGTSLVSPLEDRAWHRLVWSYITDNHGFPVAKFHSFGNTSPYTLLTMPFYSADSASWMIQAGRAGRVKLQGKSYQLRSNSIGDNNFISHGDSGLKRESWEQEITALGLNPESVMNVQAKGAEMAMIRSYLVAADLLLLQEQTRFLNRFIKPSTLITNKKQEAGGFVRDGPVNLYFVISPSAFFMNAPVLASLNIQNILVSYYYIVTAPKNFWDEMLVPFMADPNGFCQAHPKIKKFWDKLNECLIHPAQPVLQTT